MLDLNAASAAVRNWSTPRFEPDCSPQFLTYVHDVDFSPDGAYFVVVTTGGTPPNRLCDSASRWETAPTGCNLQPTWIDYTGGDTLWSVAITGVAVYVGGHQRWLNNTGGSNAAAPGAVLSRGPGRTRSTERPALQLEPDQDPRCRSLRPHLGARRSADGQ